MRFTLLIGVVAGFLSALAAFALWTSGVDAEQARVCRTVIPALNPEGSRLAIGKARASFQPNSLRIAYEASGAEGKARQRFVICLFAGSGPDARKGELVGVATEHGPMSDASFHFLKRFWLEDRAAPAQDPGEVTAPLPEVGPALAYGVQQFLVALPSAATYALIASAYALIYGLVGRIVLAFGEFAALGSLAGVVGVAAVLSLAATTPLAGVAIAFAFAVLAAGLHGFAAGRLAIGRLMRGGTGQQVLIGSVGLSLALSEYLRLAVGPETRWLPPVFNEPWPLLRAGNFVATATPVSLAAAGAGFLAAAALILYLRHSGYGRAWRALADDPKAAALCGVDARAVLDRAFVIACALSGAAGLIVMLLYGGMGFAGGFTLGLKALIAAVLGGIGSVGGACLGALAIAGFEAAWSASLPIEHRDLAVYALLALTLVLKPGGFFGEAALAPREI